MERVDNTRCPTTLGPVLTVSYSKALGLLTRAKANQAVEDYAECADTAERARFYIAESRKGR